MIVVSHRGPYQFTRTDNGDLVAHRGAGGIVSALAPLLADKSDATWIAAAMSDEIFAGLWAASRDACLAERK